MIIDNQVFIKLNPRNIEYYKNIGYKIEINKPIGKKILVNINDLPKGSSVLVNVECDYCNKIKIVTFKEYNRNISNNNKFSCCNKCGSIKRKEMSVIKYGVDSPSMLDYIKVKSENTNLKKWGYKSYMSSDDFRNKSAKTMLEKWGVENPMYSDEIKERLKEKMLEKWGVENSFQSSFIKNKIKKTNLDRYGVENYSMTDEYKVKFRKTCLERYGVENYNNYDKIKKTILDRYGVENYMLSCEFRKKSKITNLEKWGVEFPIKSEEIKNKVNRTNLEKWGFDWYTSSNDFKIKSKKTNLEKWGVEYITQSEKIRKLNNNNCKDIDYIKYIGDGISLYNCNKNHTFEIKSDNYISRKRYNIPICTKCNPIGDSKSIKEKELFEYIKEIYTGDIIQSWRDGLEVDIYLPHLKLGFEFNGLYWHSELYKDRWYHLNKTKHFEKIGIRIIHIWEDDWNLKVDIIKSQVKNWLGITKDKIFARKCKVIEVKDVKTTKSFLYQNHIQGSVASNLKLGLYFGDELVSLMTFDNYEGRKKMESSGWNINRFCNKLDYNVIGGASKLLSYFIKKYKPNRIISYSDNDWSNGNLYTKIGFKKVNDLKPDYKYIINNERVNKSRFRKGNLKTNLTESKEMKKSQIHRIWDCGKTKWEII
jgi:hypothetical protein